MRHWWLEIDETYLKIAKEQELDELNAVNYVEPNDLEGIREASYGEVDVKLTLSDQKIKNRIHGAWLGRIVGCLLGQPVEGTKRPALMKLLNKLGVDGIPDYLWRIPGLEESDCEGIGWGHKSLWSYRGLDHFPGDDDTNYTALALSLVKKKGLNFTSEDVAYHWLSNLPFNATCTAERVAYKNCVNGISPPESATLNNPYREWIGAQIRADLYGYISLGNPRQAAELAWRDARISHVKNGIYGAMWVAAMLAAAPCADDMSDVVCGGLSQIPTDSRLCGMVSAILVLHDRGDSYQEVINYIHKKWDENNGHHWCHVIANAQIVTAALLYSEGDFEKAITNAVLPCFDTDCNAATVGSIMGMMLGADKIPEKWTGLLNDRIVTAVSGYQDASIDGMADEMYDVYRSVRSEAL